MEQEPEYVTRNDVAFRRSISSSVSCQNPKKKAQHVQAEEIRKKFAIKINNATRINCCDEAKVAVRLGIYHGEESLCHTKTSADMFVTDGEATWDESVPFDIDVADIPRMARLCVVLFEQRANKIAPLTWANITIFDFRSFLRSGCICLSMWRYANEIELDNILNPLGTVMANPYADEATTLTITFEKYTENEASVIYEPVNDEQLLQIEEELPCEPPSTPKRSTSKSYFDQFKQICERDLVLTQMHEQDKELVWFLKGERVTLIVTLIAVYCVSTVRLQPT